MATGSTGDAATTGASAEDASAATTSLGAAERESLLYMREEEKLARDVYFLNQGALPVFEHIAASEQQHMDIMLSLVTRFRLNDPVGSNTHGVFVNANLQALYAQLSQRSLSSLEEALRVGAEIEELDIVDLRKASQGVSHKEVTDAYQLLTRGSENHLRAFLRNLAMRGITYTPVHLAAGDFAAISAGGTVSALAL